jgi:photosystem II stability/assembly factor-like uncharacterized protein
MRHPVLAIAASLLVACAAHAAPRGWDNVGPPGGGFKAVEADSTDAAHVALLSEVIHETRDGGATWRELAIPCNASQLRIRGDSIYLDCGFEIKRSRDRGQTWEKFSRYSFPGTSGGATYGQLVLHPTRVGPALVYSSGLVDSTQNDGASWSYLSADQVPAYPPKFQAGNYLLLFGMRNALNGGRLEFVESANMGSTWSVTGVVEPAATCYGRDVARDAASTVYITTDCGLAISRNGGATWEMRPTADLGVTFLGTSKVYADPQRSGRVAITVEDRIVTSVDAGRTWSTLVLMPQVAMAMGPDGTVWTAEWGRVYRYDPWGKTAAGLEYRHAYAQSFEVAGVRSEVLFTFDNLRTALRSADGGATWSPLQGEGAQIEGFVAVPDQPRQLYGVAGYYGERLWFSRDAGSTWESVALPQVPPGYAGLGYFQPVGPQPGVIYAALLKTESDGFGYPRPYGASAVRSVDGGRNWKVIGAELPGIRRSIVPSAADPMTAYLGTEEGYYRTRDAGASWQRIWTKAEQGAVSFVRVDRRDPRIVYLMKTDSTLWASDDGGDHWRAAPTPTASTPVFELLADASDVARAFSISQMGDVFETRDAARSWSRVAIGASPPFRSLFTSARIAQDGTARRIVATADRTILSRDLSKGHPIALGTDLWLNPVQPGWGLSLTQHDNFQMFAVWYTYDAEGKPRWFFIPGGTWIAPNVFRGTLFSARYTAPRDFFTAAFDPDMVVKTPVGEATLDFSDERTGTADFAMSDGARITQPIQRFAFGPVEKLQLPMSDLWWNPLESGWGITLHQQYSTVFATWFLYDEQGKATWLTMPNAKFVTGYQVSGDLYRAQSNPGTPYAASAVVNNRIGTADLQPATFETWSLNSTVGSVRSVKTISPLPF